MSVITRTKRLIERAVLAPVPADTVTPFRSFAVAEAPDRGLGPVEAPESYRGRSAEAPDAGDTRGGSSEGPSTGRSRS